MAALKVIVIDRGINPVVYTVPMMKKFIREFPDRNRCSFVVMKSNKEWGFTYDNGGERTVKRYGIGRAGHHPEYDDINIFVFNPTDTAQLNVAVLWEMKVIQANIRNALGVNR